MTAVRIDLTILRSEHLEFNDLFLFTKINDCPFDSLQLLKKLVTEEAFVSLLCFDCNDDLKIMMKFFRSGSESPLKVWIVIF